MEITANSTEDTKKLAAELATFLSPSDVVALYGDLGSGKTTFTRYLVESLGFESRVQSPTYVIVRTYKSDDPESKIKLINHIDLYRITNSDEVEDLGLTEIFLDDNAVSIIEWPEVAKDYLPEDVIIIKFKILGEDKRLITFDTL